MAKVEQASLFDDPPVPPTRPQDAQQAPVVPVEQRSDAERTERAYGGLEAYLAYDRR